MTFHEERFPTDVSFGSIGGPERRTEIVTLANGHEERNTPWAHSRRRFDAGMGLRSLDDLERVIAFFEARRGPLNGFRWKDWSDFKSCRPSADPAPEDQFIGLGDGQRTVFRLTKTYGLGAAAYARPITKPVAGTVRIACSGEALTIGDDVSVDVSMGTVIFASAPASGVPITAGFEFDVPVRFDTDRLSVSIASFGAGEIPAIPILELRI